jgi:hypothetical protein
MSHSTSNSEPSGGKILCGTVPADPNPPLRERRIEPRYPTNEPATLIQVYPAAPGRVDVVVLDVSQKGMQLQILDYIAPGTLVQIRLTRLIAVAEVRYCRRKGSQYLAGIRVLELLSRTGKCEELV